LNELRQGLIVGWFGILDSEASDESRTADRNRPRMSDDPWKSTARRAVQAFTLILAAYSILNEVFSIVGDFIRNAT
jgi:hypothetical protein